jgi:hypothetical protein
MCLPHALPRRGHVRSDKRACRAEAILFATAVTSRMRAADGERCATSSSLSIMGLGYHTGSFHIGGGTINHEKLHALRVG